MAGHSGAIFQELSSRLANSVEEENGEPVSPKPPIGNSPQVPKKPPKSPPNEKTRSNTTGKGKKVRITVDSHEDRRQTIGAMPLEEEVDPQSPKKKHGVWKGIKRFFGKRKDKKSTAEHDKRKSSKEGNIGGQLKAKSEPEIRDALDASSGLENSKSRYSWSGGLDKTDSQKSDEYRRDRMSSSPSDDERGNDKFSGGLPKKIRDSFRNRFKLKRRKSDNPSDVSDGNASGTTTPRRESVKELMDTDFFDDSFYTASLSPLTEATISTPDNAPLAELPSMHDSSQLSVSSAAKHKMQVAPKARRKPARFRNRPDADESTISPRKPSVGGSSNASSLSTPARGLPIPSKLGSSEKLSSQDNIDRTSSSGSRVRLNDSRNNVNETEGERSQSMEHLPATRENKKPIPAPRPRPKSLGPGLITGEVPGPKKESLEFEVTVTKSPASKRKVLPSIPQSRSITEMSTQTFYIPENSVKSSASDDGSIALVTGGAEMTTGGVEVTTGGQAITPQSTTSDWEHIDALTPENDERRHSRSESHATNAALHQVSTPEKETVLEHSRSAGSVDGQRVSGTDTRIDKAKLENVDSSAEQVRNNSTGEYVNADPLSAKSSEFARKRPPPDASQYRIESPKLQHAAEVYAIRASQRANSDASSIKQATSPIYEQPVTKPSLEFKKRQWSSMKAKKADIVDLRSLDVEPESPPLQARSFSMSSNRYQKGVMSKSKSTDQAMSESGSPSGNGKDIPDWIRIAQMKHKKIVGEEVSDEEKNGSTKDEQHSAPLPPVKPAGLLTSS